MLEIYLGHGQSVYVYTVRCIVWCWWKIEKSGGGDYSVSAGQQQPDFGFGALGNYPIEYSEEWVQKSCG